MYLGYDKKTYSFKASVKVNYCQACSFEKHWGRVGNDCSFEMSWDKVSETRSFEMSLG